LVLVIVAMVSALTAMRLAIHGQEVQVPPLVGLAPADAERVIAGLGLQMSIERQYYSPQIPEGRIMSQLPLPGTKVRQGWHVRVAVPVAPPTVDAAGNPVAAMPVIPATPPAQPSPASIIVSQVPGVGQRVVAGTVVSFEVR